MKNLFITGMIFVCSLASVQVNAARPVDPKKEPITQEQVDEMMNRIDEIRNMDMKELSRSEKKELRKEVRMIKRQVAEAHTHGGIYISAGAIIIILLLIILL